MAPQKKSFQQADPSFRERYGIAQGVPLLLTVGSHTGTKGHRLSIQAFRRARIGRSVLVVIGNSIPGQSCLSDCRRRAWLTRLASMGRKRVLLLNPPRADVLAAYHAADLFVFCSNLECSPLVLFEAMASRTPFLTVACGNAKEIAEWGHGGIVVPTVQCPDGLADAKPDAMARAIEDLMSNPNKRLQLAEAGYAAWQQRFTWDKIATQYEELYQGLIGHAI